LVQSFPQARRIEEGSAVTSQVAVGVAAGSDVRRAQCGGARRRAADRALVALAPSASAPIEVDRINFAGGGVEGLRAALNWSPRTPSRACSDVGEQGNAVTQRTTIAQRIKSADLPCLGRASGRAQDPAGFRSRLVGIGSGPVLRWWYAATTSPAAANGVGRQRRRATSGSIGCVRTQPGARGGRYLTPTLLGSSPIAWAR
jgi:hypothetical protein